jgi:dipeptidyl-peptidase III
MASISPEAGSALDKIIEPPLSVPPHSLGFPDDKKQSNYYPGVERVAKEEVAAIAKMMEKHEIEPENTRICKVMDRSKPTFEILQAPAQNPDKIDELPGGEIEGIKIYLKRGDHTIEMAKVCSALKEAVKYAASDKQSTLLSAYIEIFSTGSLRAYRRSQKTWVTDISPRVENIFGFVEPYRDPYGVRAKRESAVCISDPDETSKLNTPVSGSTKSIRMLPWAVPGENDVKGPFEASLLQAPHFTTVLYM